MPFNIVRCDITKLSVDVIVNAANTQLQMGGGVCGAIFAAAGADRLAEACDACAPIETGEAVITPGFDLPAKYIIHTAGPVYLDGKHSEEAQLRSCYINSLALAVEQNCESIAFPLISSGIYGYPKAEALRVAADAIRDFIDGYDIDAMLVVYDEAAMFEVNENLIADVDSYIYRHYLDRHHTYEDSSVSSDEMMVCQSAYVLRVKEPLYKAIVATPSVTNIDNIVDNLGETFSATLMRLIGISGKKDPEIYRRANVDRRLFSKIRSNAEYAPSKVTVLAFAIALELSLSQTEDLLERAGFALSHSRKFDVIVEFFIASRKYDIYEINEVLFNYDQPLLGG